MRTLSDYTKKSQGTGGKNIKKSGFYEKNGDQSQHFIKFPDDPIELFAELFVGLLIEKFKARGLIPEEDHDSLICAGCIEDKDEQTGKVRYGLIQPKKRIRELCKEMGDEKDRSAIREVLDPDCYQAVLAKHGWKGLDINLAISLLFSDYSVHSGNEAWLLDENGDFTGRVARIDWGAALRDFGDSKNQMILNPREYQGSFNIKKITKNYIMKYAGVPGLFEKIGKRANEISRAAGRGDLFEEMISEVLSELPQDLLTPAQKKDLAKYIGLPTAENIVFGKDVEEARKVENRNFAQNFAGMMRLRLNKIKALGDKKSNKELIEAFIKKEDTGALLQLMKRENVIQSVADYIKNIFSGKAGERERERAKQLMDYAAIAEWMKKNSIKISLARAGGDKNKVIDIYKRAYSNLCRLPRYLREASPFYWTFKKIEDVYNRFINGKKEKEQKGERKEEQKEERKVEHKVEQKEEVILSVDWDKTLVHGCNGQLSETLVEAMRFAEKNGKPVYVTTSRNIFDCLSLIEKHISKHFEEKNGSKDIDSLIGDIDLYVCFEPRLKEIEARELKRPIVCTFYDPASEQILDGKDTSPAPSEIKVSPEVLIGYVLKGELKLDGKIIELELEEKIISEIISEFTKKYTADPVSSEKIDDFISKIIEILREKKCILDTEKFISKVKDKIFSKGKIREEFFPRGRMAGGFYYQCMDHVSNYIKNRIKLLTTEGLTKDPDSEIKVVQSEIKLMKKAIEEGTDWEPSEETTKETEEKKENVSKKPPKPSMSRIAYLLKREHHLNKDKKKEKEKEETEDKERKEEKTDSESGRDKGHQFKWIPEKQRKIDKIKEMEEIKELDEAQKQKKIEKRKEPDETQKKTTIIHLEGYEEEGDEKINEPFSKGKNRGMSVLGHSVSLEKKDAEASIEKEENIVEIRYTDSKREAPEVNTNILFLVCDGILPSTDTRKDEPDPLISDVQHKIELIIIRLDSYIESRIKESKKWHEFYGIFRDCGKFTGQEKIKAANKIKECLEAFLKALEGASSENEEKESSAVCYFDEISRIKQALLQPGSRLNEIIKDINIDQLKKIQKKQSRCSTTVTAIFNLIEKPLKLKSPSP